jgi:AraC-like DNA-binding protein
LAGTGLSAQHIEDNFTFLDSLLNEHKNMHFYQSATVGKTDSVWCSSDKIYLYFDIDLICRQFIHKGGYNAIPDEIEYLYFSVFEVMTPERKMLEIEKMKNIARSYKSDALMHEAELIETFTQLHLTDKQFDSKIINLQELLQKSIERKDILMQIRIQGGILHFLYYGNKIFEALEEAVKIVKILDKITDEQYVGRRQLYFTIGEIFYLYGYPEQAIVLLKKALKPATHFFERNNLRANNNLGLYYRNEENLDLSDSYFRSILTSSEQVKFRGEYDAIAICNLGKNYLLRQDYKKAEQLLQKGLPVLKDCEPTFSAGVYINLVNCYLNENKLMQTKEMIDSAQKFIFENNAQDLYIELYPLMSKYYCAIGNHKASLAYNDSTIKQYAAYQKQYNVSHIFHAEKKLYEAEQKVQEEQLNAEKITKEKYRDILITCLLIIFLSVCFYVFYVRLRQRKNRILYKWIIERNRSPKINKGNIVQRLDDLMRTEQLFTDPDLTRKILATRLHTNENYLIKAIHNNHNGQTFSDYINSLRLKYAYQLLQNNLEFSIKEVAGKSGFSSYNYFHKLFREEFGMSPSDFRNISRR